MREPVAELEAQFGIEVEPRVAPGVRGETLIQTAQPDGASLIVVSSFAR